MDRRQVRGEERDGRSRLSRREAIVAAAAVSRLVELGVSPSDVGVITLYRAQAARVSRELAAAKTTSPGKTQHPGGDVRVSTVDAFQGQEKEVIVLSLCGDGGGGGAFTSRERVNVALTRAKRHLIVLGDSRHSAVRSYDAWAKCLAAARRAPGGFVAPRRRSRTGSFAPGSPSGAWYRGLAKMNRRRE